MTLGRFDVDEGELERHMAQVIPLTRAGPREVDASELDPIMAPGPSEPSPPNTEIPPHLLNVPGLVGHITRWITKTALYPVPLLGLGTALAVVGTAAGRKFIGPTKSGTHLYVLGVAPTGVGKNHAPKQAKRLLRAASMDDLIGPTQFMSEPALYQHIAAQPLMLCFMDEFGSYLARINNPKGSSGYEKAISGGLRSFWGASFDTIYPPAWAKSSSRDVLKPIQAPALSIYGMSVHEEFYQALQGADIANGFLNRFLVFGTQRQVEEVEPELDETVIPPQLVDWLQRIAASRVDAKRTYTATEGHTPEIRVDWDCADTRLTYKAFSREMRAKAEDSQLMSRVPEIAVRLATIRAIGKVKDGVPMIDMADLKWGCELSLWSAERMIADTIAYMVESEHQGRAKEVLRYIKAAPGGRITHTDLNRKVKNKFDARVLRLVLEGLSDAAEIEIVRVRNEGSKKPTDFILYTGG